MKTMKLKSIIYLLALTVFSSCSSTKVITDKDASEDFTQFKTFEYYGWTENSDQLLNRFDKERIEAAFVEEAKKRGLTGVKENGDVIVSLFILGEVKTQKTANTTTTGMGGMNTMGRGRRGMGGPAWGWGATQSHTVVNETNYIEGSLMVEMFDVEDKKLIWQAIGTKRISEDPKKREKGIPNKVAAIMKTYPVKPIKE